MGWSISPNDTASINETTGVASFSANTEATDKKYTVTYTDEYGCSNSLEYTVPAFSACNPNPTFSNLTCDANGRHECTITTTNPCTTAVINYTLTDSAGNIASGGVNITKIGDYTFTASTTMVAGNVTVKWWNTADTSVSGTSTITSPGECTPVCNTVQYATAGYPDDCTFSCNGQTSTSSNDSFTIPSGSSGATITVSCPSDKVAITSSFYVKCGEYCTFEIYQIVPIDVYGEVGTTGWATIHVEGVEEEIPTVDVDFSAEYRCTVGDDTDHDYYGYVTVNDGEWREHLDVQCSGVLSWYEQSFVVEKATFPETGTNERFDSGSYTCFRIS